MESLAFHEFLKDLNENSGLSHIEMLSDDKEDSYSKKACDFLSSYGFVLDQTQSRERLLYELNEFYAEVHRRARYQ